MVIHCTVEVPTWNSAMRVGNVTFMAVSTTTPENDMMPAAATDSTSLASSLRSYSIVQPLRTFRVRNGRL